MTVERWALRAGRSETGRLLDRMPSARPCVEYAEHVFEGFGRRPEPSTQSPSAA